MKKILLFTIAIVLTACSFTASRNYNQNLTKWQSASMTHYRFSLSVGCFCPFMDDMPVTVEVRNNEIVSIVSTKGTTIDSTNSLYPMIKSYATIDSLFVELKSAWDTADEVSVTYDPTYGFPASISIDQIKQAVDDEVSVTVKKFEVLK